MDEQDHEDSGDGDSGGGSGLNADVIKSYLAFGKRAIRSHLLLGLTVIVIGVGLTVAIAVFFPRTYVCKTVVMALSSPILDRNDAPNPLTGAESLILRQENLETLIRDTNLVQKFEQRRPPLLRLKDRLSAALSGPLPEKIKIASLVGTMESKITVTTERNELGITVQWSDGPTTAELADAARESFLRARHSAEISAFEDKMAIFDEHATKLRDEVATLADQMNAANAGGATPNAGGVTPTPAPAPAGAPRTVQRMVTLPAAKPNALVTEQLANLREKLAADKPKLAELEGEWKRRLRDQQAKVADLKLRLTPSHPEVVTEEGRVAMLSQPPSEVTQLRAEISALETDIKARELITNRATTVGGGVVSIGGAGGGEPLSPAIVQALQKEDADPALRAQLSGAIVKYGDLRNQILSGRIDLDTAQAAFNHRYQIITPAEVPSKPTKPKPALIIAGGVVVSILLALLLSIVSELRKDVIVERWQVTQLQLPVLAELRLPPRSD